MKRSLERGMRTGKAKDEWMNESRDVLWRNLGG
jgi:hypothetical protein